MAKILSERAEIVENWEDFLQKYMLLCHQNEYNEKNNPDGFINLGTAVNNLCCDIIYPKISSKDVWTCDTTMLQYCDSTGIYRLRKALAAIMTEFLECRSIDPEDLCCCSGVTGCIDLLSHCIADPGDVFLVPTPMYGRIYTDCMQRSHVDIWPIPIITRDNKESYPVFTIDKVKAAYEDALSKSCKVRGLYLINPSNPLGDVYSPELLMEILEFCHSKNLHIIVDEVYALSTYLDGKPFHSFLKFTSVPDPDRTHVLYGLSKDFSVAGLRIGCIHTKSKKIKKCLDQLCSLQNLPFPMMDIAARLLEDIEFCRKYFRINRERLTAKFYHCADHLRRMGLNVRKSEAGFYLWVDFGNICGSKSFAQERHFFQFLIDKHRVYMVPGKEVFCEQPGWFRICFSSFPDHVDEGLCRLEKAVKEYKPIENPTSK